MAELLKINLVTPEKLFFSGDVEMVVIPGSEGVFGVLKDHAPVVAMVDSGILELHTEGDIQKVFIAGGYAEVNGENCTILAEELVNVAEMNADSLKKEIDQMVYDIDHSSDEREKAHMQDALDLLNVKLDAVA